MQKQGKQITVFRTNKLVFSDYSEAGKNAGTRQIAASQLWEILPPPTAARELSSESLRRTYQKKLRIS